jgi:fumarylacetoacetate (FAA) hydrolase
LSGRLLSRLDGVLIGDPDPGVEMTFSFPDLIAHAARTRPLGPGTIMGSGTVSNTDRARGSSCLLERRMIEKIDQGKVVTEFMRFGQRIAISFLDYFENDPFGSISNVVKK